MIKYLKLDFIACVIIFMTLFSCENKSTTNETKNIKKNEKHELIVKMGFKTSVSDEFVLMMNNIIIDEFQKKNIQIKETVPVSVGFESIVAEFGPGNKSSNVILSLGKKQKVVVFDGIQFSYKNTSILITKSNFNKFLNTNKFVTLEKEGFTISTKIIDGKHNPALIAKKRLLDSLFK
jgi:hypothetical protein